MFAISIPVQLVVVKNIWCNLQRTENALVFDWLPSSHTNYVEKIVSLLNTDIVTLLASDLLLKMLTDLGKKYAKFTCRSPFLHVQLHQLIFGAGDGELESSKMMISVENV